MHIGLCILPEHPGTAAVEPWRRAEELGFHSAWTYDHIVWSGMPTGPWYGAVPLLAAAAGATTRIRLGTLVSSANFRHPVPFAQDIMTLDGLSDGRITIGVGAGSNGYDARVLGGEEWSSRERADRFAELVDALDLMLRGGSEGRVRSTYEGDYYSAVDARIEPGCVQTPRVPFAIAGDGPRGMRLAARQAETWATVDYSEPGSAQVRERLEKLATACDAEGRDFASIGKLVLTGFEGNQPLASLEAFKEYAEAYSEMGITDFVLHAPRPTEPFAASAGILEEVAELIPSLLQR